jgi:hypothetical protein
MRCQHPLLQRFEELGQALEHEPKLLAALVPAMPAVVRHNRPLDLDSDGEVVRDGVGGDALGIGAILDRCPGNEHA